MADHLSRSSLRIGEDVIVTKKDHVKYDQVGQIWKIRFYKDPPIISVIFDGSVYRFSILDLCLA